MTVIAPEANQRTGAAMIVLPGGAFGALAWDVEGTEVGQFLADRGITAFVLKYRVRTPTVGVAWSILTRGIADGISPGRAAAAADAEQAIKVIRQNAGRFDIDPTRVGMTGFSAGAITTLATLANEDPKSRPNIAASVYGLDYNEGLRPGTTPLFLAAAEPDPTVDDGKRIERVWDEAGAPVESHFFSSGDHGFGLGRPGTDSMRFSGVYESWLRDQGYAAVAEQK